MKLDFAFVCDYAEATGKLNALGIGFDTLRTPKIPFKHPHFSLVVQMRSTAIEAGLKSIKVNLIDGDGKDVVPIITSQVNIPKPKSGIESIGRFVIEFGNIEFKRYGAYAVHVSVDGLEIAVVAFTVAQPPLRSG